MRHHTRWGLGALFLGVACSGCGSSQLEEWKSPSFARDVREMDLRVVVLPFVDRTRDEGLEDWLMEPFVWLARLITFRPPSGAPDVREVQPALRSLLVAMLERGRIHVVNPVLVDGVLERRGLLEACHALEPALFAEWFDADAVVRPIVHEYGGRYYVLESVEAVDCSLTVSSTVDGSVLYWARVEQTSSSGVTGGPTGFTSLATEPLAALGGEVYRNLAIEATRRLAVGMLPSGVGLADEPRLSNTSVRPVVDWVTCAPVERPLRAGEFLRVVASGTVVERAWFRVGSLAGRFPLFPVGEPDSDGHVLYRGEFRVPEGLTLEGLQVFATFQTADGTQARGTCERAVHFASGS